MHTARVGASGKYFLYGGSTIYESTLGALALTAPRSSCLGRTCYAYGAAVALPLRGETHAHTLAMPSWKRGNASTMQGRLGQSLPGTRKFARDSKVCPGLESVPGTMRAQWCPSGAPLVLLLRPAHARTHFCNHGKPRHRVISSTSSAGFGAGCGGAAARTAGRRAARGFFRPRRCPARAHNTPNRVS